MSRPLEKRCPHCGFRKRNLAKHIEHCARNLGRERIELPPRVPADPDRVNVYTCTKAACGWAIVTLDVHQGTTPSMMLCGRCGADAESAFYDAAKVAGRKPTHEWYQPLPFEFRTLPRAEREHVANGGLNLRKRPAQLVIDAGLQGQIDVVAEAIISDTAPKPPVKPDETC